MRRIGHYPKSANGFAYQRAQTIRIIMRLTFESELPLNHSFPTYKTKVQSGIVEVNSYYVHLE